MQESHLDCSKFEDALDAYYDLELEADQVQAVEAHLADCAACRGRLDDIEKVVGQIKSLPEVSLPHDLSSAIEAKILSQGAQVRESSEAIVSFAPKHKPQTFYWLAGAAAVLALCFSLAQLKPAAAPVEIASRPQSNAVIIAANQLPRFATKIRVGSPVEIATSSAKIKTPVGAVAASSMATNKISTGFSNADHRSENQNRAGDKDDLLAFYEYENTDSVSDVGISTNEDGLYALKL